MDDDNTVATLRRLDDERFQRLERRIRDLERRIGKHEDRVEERLDLIERRIAYATGIISVFVLVVPLIGPIVLHILHLT